MKPAEILTGTIHINPRGFGFFTPEKIAGQAPAGREADIFVPPVATLGAMNGDTVEIRLRPSRRDGDDRPEGEVVRIVQRGTITVIGEFQRDARGDGRVISDDRRNRTELYIPADAALEARDHDVVVTEVVSYPDGRPGSRLTGRVLSVLGQKGAPGVDMLAVFAKFGLPHHFPEAVLAEADVIDERIDPAELARRRDLRDQMIITIDGPDAKDLDDAVSVRSMEGGGFRLGVHIADVSHYVREDSGLDAEALRRATSVYLIDTVVPMLPQRLSNHLCSLNPNTDKLTLSCEMSIDARGKVVDHEIFESVIRSTERMTYGDVAAIIDDQTTPLADRYRALVPMLMAMAELHAIIERRRQNRGALDFDFPESEFSLAADGKPIDIQPAERTVSNRLIESFMVVCNETVAEHFQKARVPFVYRVHEPPDPAKLLVFDQMAGRFGMGLSLTDRVTPKDLQVLLARLEGQPLGPVLSRLLLRSLMQARYDPQNLGHFGLAAPFYCHFTSPIRRYPDLQDHRIIKAVLRDRRAAERFRALVADVSIQSSECERLADSAERDVEDMRKAQYMLNRIGEEYEGVVAGVVGFGFFVALPNTVDGLVHISTLPAGYVYDEAYMALFHPSGLPAIRLGDAVRIRVRDAHVDDREIDFELVRPKLNTETAPVRKTNDSPPQPFVVPSERRRKTRSDPRRAFREGSARPSRPGGSSRKESLQAKARSNPPTGRTGGPARTEDPAAPSARAGHPAGKQNRKRR